MHITPAQWEFFDREGYVRLGQVASDSQLAAMQQRIDDIMLGTAPVDYSQMAMQLDREPGTGKPGPQSRGHKGATLAYRKIQQLEFDPVFLEYMKSPIFEEICQRTYGVGAPVNCFRAMFMNKPAYEGTYLVWHQDRWTNLDRDPQITIYTALDPATVDNGCVHIIPRSHQTLINSSHGSGFLTDEQIEEVAMKAEHLPLELSAGEVALLHNWTLHSSSTNQTEIPRRAFSICYMDGETQVKGGGTYTRIFGQGALTLEQLQTR